MAVEATREESHQQLHGGREERAEVQCMGQLGQHHQRCVVGKQRRHQPADGCAEQGEHQHARSIPATEDAAGEEEHGDLGQHAHGPQYALRCGAVAVFGKVDREERVERTERHLGQECGDEERNDVGLAQACAEAFVRCRPRRVRVVRVTVDQRRPQHGRQHRQHQPGQGADAESPRIDQPAERGHDHDEADRSPYADQAVAIAARRQVRHGDRLELRHYGVVGEAERRHHDEQAHVVPGQQEQRKAAHGQRAPQVQPADRLRRAGCQRRPQRGRDDARGVPQAHQHADGGDAQPARFQVQAPVRRERAQHGVVEEIEAGQPRGGIVRHAGRRVHGARSADAAADVIRMGQQGRGDGMAGRPRRRWRILAGRAPPHSGS